MWKKISELVDTTNIFTNLNPDFPYDQRYGLPDDFRFRVLEYAEALGVQRAAKRYNVGESTIYRWSAALRQGGKK